MKLWGPTYKIFRILIEAPHRPEIAVPLALCWCSHIQAGTGPGCCEQRGENKTRFPLRRVLAESILLPEDWRVVAVKHQVRLKHCSWSAFARPHLFTSDALACFFFLSSIGLIFPLARAVHAVEDELFLLISALSTFRVRNNKQSDHATGY